MIQNIYAVRDRATDQYGQPMFMINHGHAIRSFADEANRADAQNNIYNHPDDYDLYHLGTYDTDTGLIDSKTPEMVAVGKNVKK